MKVLWLRPNKPDDISVGRHRIARELEQRGLEVDVRNTTPRDFWSVPRASPDVVVGTTRLGAFVGAWTKIVSGTPLVVDHIDPIEQLRRSRGAITTSIVDRLERRSFRLAEQVVVTYEEELERVRRHSSNVVQTTLGVDFTRFDDPSPEVVEAAEDAVQSVTDTDSSLLIYVGGLEPPYHVREVVESMDYLDGWELLVLGDGSEREYVSSVADTSEVVHYLGTVPYEEVPGYLHLADVGISLLDDSNTLKVLEYGAAELPVVHIRGAAESVFDGAVTYTSADPADVATNVRVAVESDGSDLREIARNHRWQSVADDYEDAIVRAHSAAEP